VLAVLRRPQDNPSVSDTSGVRLLSDVLTRKILVALPPFVLAFCIYVLRPTHSPFTLRGVAVSFIAAAALGLAITVFHMGPVEPEHLETGLERRLRRWIYKQSPVS
jgi:hypothetical protein